MIYFIIILVILFLLVVWGIGMYNKLVKNRNMMEEAYSGMDVQLKKRHDLIPNLVNTVKGYASHEQETFEKVMEARAKAMRGLSKDPATAEESAAAQNQLTSAIGRLFAVAEAYPELKADANFRELQTQLSEIEGDIEKSRRYYNATVRDNNIAVESFPSSIIAGMGGFRYGVFYEMEDPTNRELPEVKF